MWKTMGKMRQVIHAKRLIRAQHSAKPSKWRKILTTQDANSHDLPRKKKSSNWCILYTEWLILTNHFRWRKMTNIYFVDALWNVPTDFITSYALDRFARCWSDFVHCKCKSRWNFTLCAWCKVKSGYPFSLFILTEFIECHPSCSRNAQMLINYLIIEELSQPS